MVMHVLILGDQLNRDVPPLAGALPQRTRVLMIESLELAESLPHHKQKLIYCFSAMRHFAAELAEAGFQVHYQRAAPSFEAGIASYLRRFPGANLQLMAPNDLPIAAQLKQAVQRHGGMLTILPNRLWLSDSAWFANWAKGRKQLRMEHFYRALRRRYRYLLHDGKPEGGRWNYDADNRRVPEPDHRFPEAPTFPPDAITREVIAFVKARFPGHYGAAEPFNWPVTRGQALAALHHFCAVRLRHFGSYQDAMQSGERQLYHSLLSPALNAGLLHPQEVIETALGYYRERRYQIPLNSIEGFVRQILGWREFIFQVYRYFGPALADANALGHHRPLPPLYWNGQTQMNCLKACLAQLEATGHNHHIQRLMVLGNLALLAGVSPQALLGWFSACYIDALEWVMVPNVLGMSQYADWRFTSKPYAASGSYIRRMSNYCQGCRYDPKRKLDANACPFNSLYWAFIDRHQARLADNPRMALIVKSWRAQPERERQALLARAQTVLAQLDAGTL